MFSGLSRSKEWRLQYTWYSIKNIPLESKPMTRIYNTCWQTMNVHIPDVLASTISSAALHLLVASILLWAASLLIAKATWSRSILFKYEASSARILHNIHIWLKMINKNTIKHVQDISLPAKQVCLVQVPTLAIARRHDFQISFEFIWYMKSLESVFRFYSILQGSWGRFTNWGKSNCNDFRINTPWLVQLISQSKR